MVLKLSDGILYNVVSCGASPYTLTIELDATQYEADKIVADFNNSEKTENMYLYNDDTFLQIESDQSVAEKFLVRDYKNYTKLENITLSKNQYTSDGEKDIYRIILRNTVEPEPDIIIFGSSDEGDDVAPDSSNGE